MRKTALWVKDPEAKRKSLESYKEKRNYHKLSAVTSTHMPRGWRSSVCSYKEMAQRPEGHMQSPEMGVR